MPEIPRAVPDLARASEFPRAVPDLAGAAASLALLLLAILARCARKPTLPPPTLQQTLLADAPPPAPTTFLPWVGATARTLVAAFLLYVLAGAECVEFGFGGFSAYFTLLARAVAPTAFGSLFAAVTAEGHAAFPWDYHLPFWVLGALSGLSWIMMRHVVGATKARDRKARSSRRRWTCGLCPR